MPSNDTTKPVGFPLYNREGDLVGITLIDREDLPLVENHVWRLSTSGYATRSESCAGGSGRVVIFMHQIILGIPSGQGIHSQGDHKDRNRLNNTKANLRKAGLLENRQNLPSYRGSSSKFRGVSWNKEAGSWRAYADISNKRYYLGSHNSEESAAKAASDFRREHMPFSADDQC